ncbi:MAG: hypothetical protein Q8L14_15760 [Myxococcales bacterium]|nr:hypothetical protein [Myxococcales bacterium]
MRTGAVLDPGGIRLTQTEVSELRVVSTASSHFVLWAQQGADGGPSVVLRRLSPDGTLLDPGPRLVLDGIAGMRAAAGERDVIVIWNAGDGQRLLRALHLDETGAPAAAPVEIGPPATRYSAVTAGDHGFVVTRGWYEEPGFMSRGRYRLVAHWLDTTGTLTQTTPIELEPEFYDWRTYASYDGTAYRVVFASTDAGLDLRHRRLEADGGTGITSTISPVPTEFLACTRGTCLISSVPDTSGAGDGGFTRGAIRTRLIGPSGEPLASTDLLPGLCPAGACSEPYAAAATDSFMVAVGLSTDREQDLVFVRLSADGGVLDPQPRRIGAGLWLRGTVSLSCRAQHCTIAWQER